MMEEKKKWKTARILCGIMALLLVIAIPISIMIRDGYGQQEKWACLPQTIDKEVDVFFIAPTVYFGDDTHFNLSLKDEETKTKFVGAIQMEKGIYDESCNFYAPFYRQAALNVYTMPLEQQSKYMDLAYKDVKKAFHYYLKHYNTDRPFIIAGFSQGAQMSLRLLEDYFAEEEYQNRLIAAYVIGGAVTEEDLINYPHLKMAEGEADTGCIISFNSEAEHTTTSLIVPTATLGINPLNWKTDSTPAEADLNQGACFTGYDGEIKEEIPYLCGAYLDEKRGTLKITGIEESDYPPGLDMFDPGVYHIYDYQFFYRNLQKNVALRVKQYQTLQALKNRNKEAKATVETDLSIETKPEVGNMAVNVTSAMMDEAYWLDLCQNKEELVMSIQDVQIFNENHTSAVSKFGYTYYAQGVEKEIISRDELLSLLNQNTSYQNDRFLNGKEVEPEFY
ncbi:MAG: DUF3089 domain-containing protein, partial [Clostridia bacterium]|nr:DUF3089 domain-containing protein [Clostridia bacterium]